MSKERCLSAVLFSTLCLQPCVAHDVIWRCGEAFTDDPRVLSSETCQLLVNKRIPVSKPSRIHRDEQRVRDIKARTILEAELRRAEQQQGELSRASMSPSVLAAIKRTQGDIAGLRREIERFAQ